MKFGIVISLFIVLIFLTALVLVNQEQGPSSSTDLTAEQNLQKVTLPDDLPQMFRSPDTSTQAGPVYRKAISYFRAHKQSLTRQKASERPHEQVEQLRQLMVKAMHAGRVENGFLDEYLTMQPGTEPELGPA